MNIDRKERTNVNQNFSVDCFLLPQSRLGNNFSLEWKVCYCFTKQKGSLGVLGCCSPSLPDTHSECEGSSSAVHERGSRQTWVSCVRHIVNERVLPVHQHEGGPHAD